MLKIKKSAWDLLDGSSAFINPEQETCPICQNKGLATHAYYSRTLIDFVQGQVVSHQLRVRRVSCPCGHTHAVLFDLIVPYERHTLLFILRALSEYFVRRYSVEKICEIFQITQKRLYSWVEKWNEHKEIWLGKICSLETTSMSFLDSLQDMDSFSDFSADFVKMTSVSFLQVHANPPVAPYAQRVFDPDYSFPYTT